MSKINVFALGGQDEIGRNCFILEVDGAIYVLNCGIEIPPTSMLGIKKLIPDYTWLQKNKANIAGVFFGYPCYENIGSLQYLVENIKNVTIYTSLLGKEIIQSWLLRNSKAFDNTKVTVVGLKSLKKYPIKNVNVTAFRVSNSMIGSVGWIFETEDGNIVYVDDFIVSHDQNHLFESNLDSLQELTSSKKNLLLLAGINNVGSEGFTIPKNKTKRFYEKIINASPKRVFVACYERNTYAIFTLCQIAKMKKRPIIFYSDNFINLFNAAVRNRLFNNQHLLTLPISKINTTKNAIVTITSSPFGLYSKLAKIISGEDDKIAFQEDDTFVLGTQTIAGNEAVEAKIIDEIARLDVIYHRLPKEILPMKASDEDQKYLISLLKPDYIVPISGLYKDFCKYSFAAYQTGFPEQNIKILYNGEMLTFNNGQLEKKITTMNIEPKCVDSSGMQDIGSNALFERNQMGENGAVVIILYFYTKTGKFHKEIYHKSVGVTENKARNDEINTKVHALIAKKMKELEEIYQEDNKLKFSLEMKKSKLLLRNTIGKIYTKICGKKPVILQLVIEL